MSYDVSLVIDTGGEAPAMVCDVGNMTWNVGGMFLEALGFPLCDLDGMGADLAAAHLARATAHMATYPDTYEAMNPANGWGDYESAMEFLTNLHRACRDHPKASVVVD